jgi:elongation factor Tu
MAVTICTIGAAGHGKTTLTAAIMYCLGVAYPTLQSDSIAGADASGVSHETYATPAHEYAHADGPASQRDAMVAGLPKVDAAILVVSATDGPMPGTRDSIATARKAGIANLAVYLNKSDLLADPEMLELIELEVRDLLGSQGYSGDSLPVIAGSATEALASSGTPNDPKASTVFALVAAIEKNVPAGVN